MLIIMCACHATNHITLYCKTILSSALCDLNKLLDSIVQQIPNLDEVVTYHDVLDVAMIKTVVRVGKVLIENQALLLPTIHSIFRQARILLNAKGIQEPQEFTTLSSRWILSELVGRLQHHMVYTCKVHKYGTLPSSDIVLLLTEAMWKLRNAEQAEGERDEEQHADYTTAHSTDQQHVNNINKLIHSQIQTFMAEDTREPYEHDNLNIDILTQKIHPELWEEICLLTRSQRQSRGTSAVNGSNVICVPHKEGASAFLTLV